MAPISQLGQEVFVLNQTNHKKYGTFVDVGGGHPKLINNTFTLEKDYLWWGISLDIGPPYTHECDKMTMQEYIDFWNSERTTPIVIGDALKIDFVKLFEDNSLPTTIDYLSLDLDPPVVTYECLKLIPFDKYKFNIITFETDYYREKTTREPSRKLLASHGYTLATTQGGQLEQEDWYIRKD